MNRFVLMLALGAFTLAAPFPVMADDAKPKKMKLDTLKKGPVQIEPDYGYIVIRVGPKSETETPTAVAFRRIDPATDLPLTGPDTPNPKDFARSLSAVVNTTRPFDIGDGVGVYVVKVYPGRWVLNNVGGTCLSLGTYTVDVKAGQVVDFGTVLTAREDGKTTLPEFEGAALSEDLVKFGTMMNIVMTDAVFVKPAVAGASMPAELAGLTVAPATLGKDYRFDNFCAMLVNRATSLSPLEHPKPISQEDAKALIDKINGK